MKKIIFILFISQSIFCKSYTVEELLSLYEKNSNPAKENTISEIQFNMRKDESLISSWKDLSLELSPSIVSNSDKKITVYALNTNYRNFFYKINIDNMLEKQSESFGYKSTFYGAFFEASINRKTSYVNTEIESLKSKKNFIEQKQGFIEKIYQYIFLLGNLKIYEDSLRESIKEKEILQKKEILGELEYLDLINNDNEISSLENNIAYVNSEKKVMAEEIATLSGIPSNFTIQENESKLKLNKYSLNLDMIEKNLNLIEIQIKKEKYNFLDNLNFSYEYNSIEKSNIGSLSYIYRPFDDTTNKKLLKMDKEKLELQLQEEKRIYNKEMSEKVDKLVYLQSEYNRNKNYQNKYSDYYENFKRRFEKNQISYDSYLKMKKEYRDIEKSLLSSYIDLEKFKILASI